MDDSAANRRAELRALAGLFLRLGATAFGGPAVHIAIMEDEVVHRKKWLTRDEFMDLLGATNLIPGPNSTELAIHIGHRRAGWPGLIVAGSCFILPAVLIVGVIAWAYVRYGSMPEAQGLLYGVKPVVLAIVLQAIWRLGRTALKTKLLWCVSGGAAAACFLGVDELLVLLAAGAAYAICSRFDQLRKAGAPMSLLGFFPLAPFAANASVAASAVSFGLWPMFLFFLKVGSILYGSGYVLLAFLRADLVDRWQWLTESQLLDAIAIGQITPGPLFTTATFIGYILAGVPGAVAGTAGLFLPAFVFVAISGPLVPRIRSSATAGAVLDGVNAAALALMAVVTLQLAGAAFVDLPTIVLGLAGAFLLLAYRVQSTWLICGGAVIGLGLQSAGFVQF